ncbi:MAG: tRNA (N(6)-L-threonylcarbamoyladenosine(37)-C(2))-methylthiotransferase MtaB [Clostridia bacterium]|nr:tRNA (N(6)-L-threonylcarbamoyladenosine(37)-C(2))-methylthiotransferase MtaB [Clostridia bacterium]
MKVKLYTLGCKVNQYETQEITENLIKGGFTPTFDDSEADVFIVNSCTVTSESDRKTRQLVRRLKRNYKNAVVVLTGCMPQAFPEASSLLEQADIVIGNKNNDDIVPLLKSYKKERIVNINEHLSAEQFCGSPITDFNERTRAIVKIEDGCDRFCSYCIIPKARGRVRSKSIPDIKNEVAILSEKGFSEIVLVGINLSAYGKDSGEKFSDAVAAACIPEGIKRVRLGSLEPDHITDEVINALAKLPKLCPQFHISLQSGCDKTLKRMNRHYTADEYYELCKKLRSVFADCTLTTDIMVGFSGESEEDFLQTVEFAKKVGFEKIHIFPYSVREGTRAAELPDRLPRAVKEERAAFLNKTAVEIRKTFLENQVSKTVEIIPESKHRSGYIFGYTPNYTPVLITKGNAVTGRVSKAIITDSDEEYCYAQLIEE